uniref:(northern house mosquito) hypothetical protein n=1 Tax=Culex pipiens TaxID=7175 RepID=A0A8D8GT17_CULPI
MHGLCNLVFIFCEGFNESEKIQKNRKSKQSIHSCNLLLSRPSSSSVPLFPIPSNAMSWNLFNLIICCASPGLRAAPQVLLTLTYKIGGFLTVDLIDFLFLKI